MKVLKRLLIGIGIIQKINKSNDKPMKLSIIIPVYNEKNTILAVLKKVEEVELISNLEKEIIIIDDCSTDGTRDILQGLKDKYKIFFLEKNQGKGNAVKQGFLTSSGDYIIIQDADLECDPNEYNTLLEPLLSNKADVVYGSRFSSSRPHQVLTFRRYFANKSLTWLSNVFTNLNLSDMETCYKVFTRSALDKIKGKLRSNRFGIEPEITALVAKNKFRIYEVSVSYHVRDYEDGKKINWKDGLAAIWYIIRYNIF